MIGLSFCYAEAASQTVSHCRLSITGVTKAQSIKVKQNTKTSRSCANHRSWSNVNEKVRKINGGYGATHCEVRARRGPACE